MSLVLLKLGKVLSDFGFCIGRTHAWLSTTDEPWRTCVLGADGKLRSLVKAVPLPLWLVVNRVSSWRKMCHILGWILRLGCPSGPLTTEEIRWGKKLLEQSQCVSATMGNMTITSTSEYNPKFYSSNWRKMGGREPWTRPWAFNLKVPLAWCD